MKIGLYYGDMEPTIGGGNTLAGTIQKQVSETEKSGYEFVYLYSGKKMGKKNTIINGIKYINISAYDSVLRKIINKLKKVFRFGDFSKSFLFDVIAKRENIDIYWFATPISADVSWPYIYTIWDLGYRTVPYYPEVSIGSEWRRREDRYSLMIPNAAYILTGNEVGKKEILTNFSIDSKKIRIVKFPISSFCFGPEQVPQFDMPNDFFFYPAQFWAHKNHICILDAVRILKEQFAMEVTVFFTGSDQGNKAFIEGKIKEYGLQNNIIITGFLKEEELKYLYTHAKAMIFASLMGPNNLPPIEATYLQCPVIITDLEGHREQLGDSALYFDGLNPAELAEQMKKIYVPDVRKNLIKKEEELANDFKKIDYFGEVFSILKEFSEIRKRWK